MIPVFFLMHGKKLEIRAIQKVIIPNISPFHFSHNNRTIKRMNFSHLIRDISLQITHTKNNRSRASVNPAQRVAYN